MNQKAIFLPRFLAAVVDFLIAWIPLFIPIIGGIFGAIYLLFKDSIMYQWGNTQVLGRQVIDFERKNTKIS